MAPVGPGRPDPDAGALRHAARSRSTSEHQRHHARPASSAGSTATSTTPATAIKARCAACWARAAAGWCVYGVIIGGRWCCCSCACPAPSCPKKTRARSSPWCTCPPAPREDRTQAVLKQVADHYLKDEAEIGASRSSPWRASASPAPARTPACAFVRLKDFDERKAADHKVAGRRRARHAASSCQIRDAKVFADRRRPPCRNWATLVGLRLPAAGRRRRRPRGPDGRAQPAAGHGRQGPVAGRRASQRPGRHPAVRTSTSTTPRPARMGLTTADINAAPQRRAGAVRTSTTSSIAAGSRRSTSRPTRRSA